MGNDPELSPGPNVITKILMRDTVGIRVGREGSVTIEAQIGVVCFEDGGKGHKPRNEYRWPPRHIGGRKKLKKARK